MAKTLAEQWLEDIKAEVRQHPRFVDCPLTVIDEQFITQVIENILERWWNRAQSPSTDPSTSTQADFTALCLQHRDRTRGVILALLEVVRVVGDGQIPTSLPEIGPMQ